MNQEVMNRFNPVVQTRSPNQIEDLDRVAGKIRRGISMGDQEARDHQLLANSSPSVAGLFLRAIFRTNQGLRVTVRKYKR